MTGVFVVKVISVTVSLHLRYRLQLWGNVDRFIPNALLSPGAIRQRTTCSVCEAEWNNDYR